MASCHRAKEELSKGRRPKNLTVRHKGAATQKGTSERRNSLASWRHCSSASCRGNCWWDSTSHRWRRTLSRRHRLLSRWVTPPHDAHHSVGLGVARAYFFLSLLYVASRVRVLVFLEFVHWLFLSLHKRPWPLRRSRGDGNGRPLLPSFVRHGMCGRADLTALDR